MSMRIARRYRRQSFRLRENVAQGESDGAACARAHGRRFQSAEFRKQREMSQGKHAIVREFRGRPPVASLAHLFHRLPQRENFRMLMRDLEATILPREYLDEAPRRVSVVSLQRHPALLVYQAELTERRPVALEQRDEVLLAPDFHPTG